MSLDSSLNLVDTHCHLNFDAFNDDRIQVIERSRGAGVSRILIPGIDIETSWSAIKYSHQFPDVFAAVGVHPNSGIAWTRDALGELRHMAGEAKVVAIGEIGLDYYRDYTPKENQRSILLQQLELAEELGLPVIIHNREASTDIVELLLSWHDKLINSGSGLANHPGVLHSFSTTVETAKTMVERNFKLGITGPITYRNAQMLQSVVISTPLESLLIETDAPYLTPHPYRGKRNEPANVRIVAGKIAELKDIAVDRVANTTTEAANQLFDWSEIH